MTKASSYGGRDTRGRFTKGNAGGPGNPHARKVAQLRSALLDSVTPKDLRAVAKALIEQAKAGDVTAIRELFDRCLGKSRQALDVEMEVEAGAKKEKSLEEMTDLELAETMFNGGVNLPPILQLKCQRIYEQNGREVPERYRTRPPGLSPRTLPNEKVAGLP